jgi:hypothetical protein
MASATSESQLTFAQRASTISDACRFSFSSIAVRCRGALPVQDFERLRGELRPEIARSSAQTRPPTALHPQKSLEAANFQPRRLACARGAD